MRVISIALFAAALAIGGCVKSPPKTRPDTPPLDAPPAPPRVVAPVVSAEPTAPAASEPANPTPPRKTPARPETRPETPPKPEPAKPDTPPKPEVTGEAGRPAVPDAARLGTPLAAPEAEVERTIRVQLDKASRALKGVDYTKLNADRRMQYDTAMQFMAQAEQALTERNLVYASVLADKAATLAAALVGR